MVYNKLVHTDTLACSLRCSLDAHAYRTGDQFTIKMCKLMKFDVMQ